MHNGCFGLNRRPFASVPQVDQYTPTGSIEGARTTLARCIERGEGAGLVIGPSGTGKTLLCQLLAEQFRRSFQVAMLASLGVSTRRGFFQAMLYELGRPYRGLDEGEARLTLVDYLTAGQSSGPRGIVLLVDEAHTLPLRVLEELRLLTNLASGGQPLVRLVMAGGPVLEERFASPKLDSFSQRLSARCYLEALNRSETEDYIRSQINKAGGRGEAVFPTETCQSVFQATGGVPRLINQLCDHALLLAYVAGRRYIEPAHVDEAWGDLQQLPTPWNGQEKSKPADGVIEFGALDDPGDEPASASTPALHIRPDDEEQLLNEVEPVGQIHRIERLLAEADEFQPAGSIVPEIELHFEDAPDPFAEEFEHEEIVADRYPASRPVRMSPVQAQSLTMFEATAPARSTALDATAPAASPEATLVAAHPAVGETATDGPTWAPQADSPLPSSRSPARRPEYRHLFARLRRG